MDLPVKKITTDSKTTVVGVDNPAFDKNSEKNLNAEVITSDVIKKDSSQNLAVTVETTALDAVVTEYPQPASHVSSIETHPFSVASISVDGFAAGLDGHSSKDICVEHLSYDVKEKKAEWWQRLSNFQMPWEWARDMPKKRKKILNDITFKVKSGEMLAVLGSSGSGKTTLLDVIACRTQDGNIEGEVSISGVTRTPHMIKECSAFVRQDDRLLPNLTVRETLTFVAKLKLPQDWTLEQINARVDSVIAELGLRHVSDSRVGGEEVRGISGGERRRVSIGVQLLLDPSILFLDEPTSGLDSFTAHHLVETLAKLARNNRIVMLSIHQPRSDIFELFDLVMLLSQGNTVYFGKATHMVNYFSFNGYPCPEFTNPCDYFVDIATVDYKSKSTEEETFQVVQQLLNHYKDSEPYSRGLLNDKDGGHSDEEPIPSCSDSEQEETVQPADTTVTVVQSQPEDDEALGKKNKRVVKAENKVERIRPKANLVKQFTVLFVRALKNNLENYGFLGIQAIEALAMSLMIGLVYFDLKLDQTSVGDRFGLLYILGALYPYMVILDVIGHYHKERFTIFSEMQDGLYTSAPYFLSKMLSEIPEHTIFIILYTVPVYFLSGMHLDAGRFFESFAMVYVIVYCSRALAMWSGALMPTYPMSVIFAQAIFTIFLLSCGFIFNLENIFVGVKWTSYISYLKWGFQGLCHAEFRGLQFSCQAVGNQTAHCIGTGQDAMKRFSLENGEVWQFALVISAEVAVFLALFYIAVRFISQKPHQT